MTTTLALLLLPLTLGLLDTTLLKTSPRLTSDLYDSIAAKNTSLISISKALVLCAYLSRSLHDVFMYKHLRLSRIQNLRSQEWWSAPCKNFPIWSFLLARSILEAPIYHDCASLSATYAGLPNISAFRWIQATKLTIFQIQPTAIYCL